MDKVFAAFLYGDTIVLTEGDARPVCRQHQGLRPAQPAEPENERVLSGPREGFTECFMPNLALIRRRVQRYTAEIQVSARRQPHEHRGLPVLYRRTVSSNSWLTRSGQARLTHSKSTACSTPTISPSASATTACRPFPPSARPNGRTSPPRGCWRVGAHRRGRQSGRADRAVSVSGVLSVQRRLLYQLSCRPTCRACCAASALFLRSRFPRCTPL